MKPKESRRVSSGDVAEREFFHGSLRTALTLLTADAGSGPVRDLGAEPTGDVGADRSRARWLTGAALGALGRYGEAFAVLRPLAEPEPGEPPAAVEYRSLAFSTLASHHRQLGRHQDAFELDRQAERTAGPVGDARFDALLGLAADAVGLGDPDAAEDRLRRTTPLVPDDTAAGWRYRVRRGWVATEIALLRGDPAGAIPLAEEARRCAVEAGAPRHVAKCCLFLGAARYVQARAEGGVVPRSDPGGLAAAARALTDAGRLAGELGALPLRWVAESLLAEIADLTGAGGPNGPAGAADLAGAAGAADLAGAAGAAEHRAAAAAAITEIGAGLPPTYRADWFGRPDLAALVAGSTPPR